MIKREHVFPSRIIKAEGNIANTKALLIPSLGQIHIGTPTKEKVTASGKGYIVLDFGVEIRGSVRILCYSANTNKLRIRLGESVGECMAELGEKGACNDHSPRDFYITLSALSDTTWGNSAFRFVRLDFEEGDEISLEAVIAESEILDLPAKYEYTGNDEQLRDIYAAAKRTIDLCSAGEYVWDGVKRDRLVWIGDMHPEMLALTTLYGRVPMMDNSINFMRATTPQGNWMCTIATYSAWWLIVLSDYFDKTDCRDLVLENLEYAEGTVERFFECIGEDGDLGAVSGSLVDWPTRNKPDENAGVRAILIMMAKRAIKLLDTFNRPTDKAEMLLKKLLKQPINVTHAMQVAGLKYMALGELDREDVALMERLGENGLSTFMSYYILEAYAHYFGVDRAVEIMKRYYTGMLSVGSTTFWEDFHLEWLEGAGRIDELTPDGKKDIHGDYGDFCYKGYRHSLCHAWSTGILAFMEENGI